MYQECKATTNTDQGSPGVANPQVNPKVANNCPLIQRLACQVVCCVWWGPPPNPHLSPLAQQRLSLWCWHWFETLGGNPWIDSLEAVKHPGFESPPNSGIAAEWLVSQGMCVCGTPQCVQSNSRQSSVENHRSVMSERNPKGGATQCRANPGQTAGERGSALPQWPQQPQWHVNAEQHRCQQAETLYVCVKGPRPPEMLDRFAGL